MLRQILIFLVIGALLAPAPTMGDAGRTETQTYIAGAFGAVASPWCYANGLTPVAQNVGGGCFDVRPTESLVTLRVTDFVLGDVGYMFRFVSLQNDASLGPWQLACGTHTFALPAGVNKIDVAPLNSGASPSASPDGTADACGVPSNWGQITAVFS